MGGVGRGPRAGRGTSAPGGRGGGAWVSSGNGSGKSRRSYRPVVEALEALRLLSDTAQALPGLAVEFNSLSTGVPLETPTPFASDAASWDEALGQTRLSDILRVSRPAVE